MYTNALLLPVRGTKTFEAPANSFCRLLWNWSQAVALGRSVATDLAVPIGHEACLAEYLDQLTLVATEENDAADTDRRPCMSRMPSLFRLPLLPTNHRLAGGHAVLMRRQGTAVGVVDRISPCAADVRLVWLAFADPGLGAHYGSLGGDSGGGVVPGGLFSSPVQFGLADGVLRVLLQQNCRVGSHPAEGQDLRSSGREDAPSFLLPGHVETTEYA